MARTHILGFPSIGAQRELVLAQEAFWRRELDEAGLRQVGAELRRQHWQAQKRAGLDCVAVGDFAWHEPVLSALALLGALPRRFGLDPSTLSLSQYLVLARGRTDQTALQTQPWFGTRLHHAVPEVDEQTRFDGGVDWLFDDVDEALAQGLSAKPVLIGPITLLWLARATTPGFDRLSLLPKLVAAYRRVLARLADRGIGWVQVDEHALCLDLDADWRAAYAPAYAELAGTGVKLLLGTGFGSAAHHVVLATQLPVQGFHIDLVRAPEQLAAWREALPANAVLSAGVVDGANVWRTDLRRVLGLLQPLQAELGERLWVAPSCSLLHVPVSLEGEIRLDPELSSWLAFATEKLGEIAVLGAALNQGEAAVAGELAASDVAQASRRQSGRVLNPVVRRRLASVSDDMTRRTSPHAQRVGQQREALPLPILPTTTLGPLPHAVALRQAHAAHRRGELGALDHLHGIRSEIELAVRKQEELGLDVLVHGQAEREDHIAYFTEQLWGCAVTTQGWVQVQGSQCVKPPLVYGDVFRPEPMTVETTRYAQSLTERPVKGSLTGPVTLLQGSFVRDDQPLEATALQLALALREEVADLEKAGVRIVQIDEPGLAEGLPLRQAERAAHLAWAVRAVGLASAGVADATQIHVQLGGAGLGELLPAVEALDADVLSVGASPAAVVALGGVGALALANGLGPGVVDVGCARVPAAADLIALLEHACDLVAPQRLWVNPGGGLDDRAWPETEAVLFNMVKATRAVRARLAGQGVPA